MTDLVTTDHYVQQAEAISVYETVESADDLFASAEEIQQLAAAGDLDQTAYIEQSEGFDNSWRYHRIVKFKEIEGINWEMKLSKEQIDEGYRGFELNPNDPNQNVVAVRGIPLEFGFTNSFSKTNPKTDKPYTFCTTDELIEHLPGKDRVTKEQYPIKMPFKRMHQSKLKPNEVEKIFWQKNAHLDPYATRTTFVKEGEEWVTVKERRSCLECVKACEHFDGDDISADGITRCRPTGRLLFVVFEVGIKNVTEHNKDFINNPIQVDWKPIAEAGILGYDNKPLVTPFVINLMGLGSSQMKSIGKGPHDLPVYLPGDISPNRPKDCILPDNNVKSVEDYYNWLNDPKAHDGRRGVDKNGKNLYPVMTELYIAKMTKVESNKKVAPVFRPVAVGPNAQFNGVSLKDYVFNAKLVLNHEAAVAQGNNGVGGGIPLLPTTPSDNGSQALPAAVVETPAPKPITVEAKSEPANNLTRAAISAFTPPTFG
jgi:hypothetical protein